MTSTVLTSEQIANIKSFQQDLVDRLGQVLKGLPESGEGQITDPKAPCYIRGAMYDAISILHQINLAEGSVK